MKRAPFIFGNQSFIGYIKYYDQEKKFGFIACNNYGMEKNSTFQETSQTFYFDQSSTKNSITKRLVVFQPAIIKGKTKALNVRDYDSQQDRALALSYYYHKNYIFFTEKETISYGYGRKRTIVNNIRIDIFSKCGIPRYEIIRQITESYKDKGETDFLWKIDKFVNIVGGDKDYLTTLCGEYDSKLMEEESIKYMFETIGEETIQKLVVAHPCFQLYAPPSSLLSILDKLNDKFGIPQDCLEKYKEVELTTIIQQKQVFNRFYTQKEKKKIRAGNTIEKGYIEKMLDCCYAENVEQLREMVNQQMLSAIDDFVENAQSYSKEQKMNFLCVYDKFINSAQLKVLNASIEQDDISVFITKCNSFRDKKYKDVRDLQTFIWDMSYSYYNVSSNVQKSVVKEIEFTFLSVLKELLLEEGDEMSFNFVETLHTTVTKYELICNELKRPTNELLKSFYFEQFTKQALCTPCSYFFIDTFGSIIPEKERRFFTHHLSKKIIENESLRIIYHYYLEVLNESVPFTLKELISKKGINQIIDCGNAFSSQSDKGFSLLSIVFKLIFNNTDDNGDFIIDNNPEGLRSHFLGYFISHQSWDNIGAYMDQLSYHDRVQLSLSDKFGLDIATPTDIKRELLDLTCFGNVTNLLKRLSNCKYAIIDIIEELSHAEDNKVPEVISWVRLFLSIENRHYDSREQKESTDNKLLNAISRIEERYNIRFSQYGIDTENKFITPCYDELSFCDKFIQFIWRCEISQNNDFYDLKFNHKNTDAPDDYFLRFIEILFNSDFSRNSEEYSLSFQASNCKCSYDNILAYITINVLNNIQYIQNVLVNKESDNAPLLCPLLLIEESSFEDYISSLINMIAKDGMDAFWCVGDRPDIETYYTDVEISFKSAPLPFVYEVLKEVIPELAQEDNTNIYSYHKRKSERASGYGRSWDYDNSIEYKNRIMNPMIKKLFLAYKKGLFITE